MKEKIKNEGIMEILRKDKMLTLKMVRVLARLSSAYFHEGIITAKTFYNFIKELQKFTAILNDHS